MVRTSPPPPPPHLHVFLMVCLLHPQVWDKGRTWVHQQANWEVGLVLVLVLLWFVLIFLLPL